MHSKGRPFPLKVDLLSRDLKIFKADVRQWICKYGILKLENMDSGTVLSMSDLRSDWSY